MIRASWSMCAVEPTPEARGDHSFGDDLRGNGEGDIQPTAPPEGWGSKGVVMSNRGLLLFSLVQTVLLFLLVLNTMPVARAGTEAQEVTLVDQRLSIYRPLPVRVTGDVDCKCK